jgi:uncharacterized glyoxalase superfamily protein PhnB
MHFSHTILYVKDVEASMAFYEKAFGLTTRFIHEEKCYGEMETGAVVLAFATYDLSNIALPDGVIPHNPSQKPQGVEICLETEDVDSSYAHAVSCGALPVTEPTDMPWGQRLARVKDIDGILISLVG